MTTTTEAPTSAAPAHTGADLSPEPLVQMLQGLQAAGILRAGIDLRVCDEIAAGRRDPTAIAASIGADERGMRILLDGLVSLGILKGTGSEYDLAPIAETFLVSSRPTYVGGAAAIFTGDWAWAGYGRLADVVRNGGTIMEKDAEAPGHEFWATFAEASGSLMTPAAHGLAELLGLWARDREELSVLDVACGSGVYGLAVARTHPTGRATLLDWDNVLERAAGTVRRLGMEDRTDYIEGDAFAVDLGGPHDVLIASHFFHHFSPERCIEVLRRFASALKPGGRIVINEFAATGHDPAQDAYSAIFSVNMLVWSREGEAHSVDAYADWLARTGFGAPEVHAAPGLPSQLIIATRNEER
jgi:ubiquinone/menaquinone biosynthesis C-methylase UbiE